MSSVLDQIRNWAKSLDYWEQVALEKIVSGNSLTDQDYDEILRYLLEDAGLVKESGTRPVPQFPLSSNEETGKPSQSIRLTRIFDVRNVNALVSDQQLTFGPQLTVIFGANRSGKSGYARILLSAASSRGNREVLSDATKPSVPGAIPEALIEISDGDTTRTSGWKCGGRIPDLALFYVFDSTSAPVHLTQSNALGFSPAGLSILTQLLEVTDEVRTRLRKQVEEKSKPHTFATFFEGTSKVRSMIESLGLGTNVEELRTLANLSEPEISRKKECETEIARLQALDVKGQIRRLERDMGDLGKLSKKVKACQDALGEAAKREAEQLVTREQESEELAALSSIDQFRSEELHNVGTSVWRDFIAAAKKLADAESSGREPYPTVGDPCLLCRQPLSNNAVSLLGRLWNFITSEASNRLANDRAACNTKRIEIESVDASFFDSDSTYRRLIEESDPELTVKLNDFLAGSRKRQVQLAALVSGAEKEQLGPLPDFEVAEVDNVSDNRKARIEALKSEDTDAQIKELEQEHRELAHRAILAIRLEPILDYIEQRKWAHRASGIGGTTRHITMRHNELFKTLVTDRYIEGFSRTLAELGHPLQVTIDTRGQKGKLVKQIALQLHESSNVPRHAVDRVLSDGEKRAVALADFLAEVETDQSSCGIILDDPVNSLDFEWKENIATRFVREAMLRQVIVFTHDLHFFSVLMTESAEREVSAETHWVKRGDRDERPGYISLNNAPACEKNYRNAEEARKYHKKSLDCPPEEQEFLLKGGFGALRTSYETFIMADLFGGVVKRFQEHILIKPLGQIVWDDSIASTVVEKHEALSRLIEGHSHSDISSMSKPTPAVLLKEIEAFDELKRRHKQLKKRTPSKN